MIEDIESALISLRNVKPLVLNLTNYVTMDFMANSLLAIGAAPIMSVCNEELEELIHLACCININIGTLDTAFIERCKLATILAQQYHKPIILDPVGAGASEIRTKIARQLMTRASIVKGNASEILALSTTDNKTLGVESRNTTQEAKESARSLSKAYGFTTVVSGPIDFITDGTREAEIPYGSSLMPLVTGMGCTLSAIISAFRGVITNNFEASLLATQYFNLCGELAAKSAKNPSSFCTHFIDNLYAADFKKLREIYNEI